VGYYQQVGRAGRGIDHASGILLTGEEDSAIHDYFRQSAFPTQSQIAEVLQVLESSDGLTLRDIGSAN
jgi:ATP-dependent DNA helicase RecQ